MTGRIVRLILLFATGSLAAYAVPILALQPVGGAVSGTPGSTVGWGFTITNDTPYYLLFDNSYFCQPGQNPLMTTCTQSLGTYSDIIASNGTEIAPMSTLTEPYSASTTMGFGSYAISPTAMVGATDSGDLVGTYMEFAGDPFSGGTQVSGDIEISAAASVTVTGIAAIPEPSSWMTMAAGLTALGAMIVSRGRRFY